MEKKEHSVPLKESGGKKKSSFINSQMKQRVSI